MTITEVRSASVGYPWKNRLFTRVDAGACTIDGRARAGEAAVHELKGCVIGRDPFDVEPPSRRPFRYEQIARRLANPNNSMPHVRQGGERRADAGGSTHGA